MANSNTDDTTGNIPRFRDSQFRDVYANQVFVSVSAFDLSVTFSKNTEIAPEQRGLLDLACVTLSPQQFKAMVKTLSNTLDAYEESFGKLSINDEEVEPIFSKGDIKQILDNARSSSAAARKKAQASLKR